MTEFQVLNGPLQWQTIKVTGPRFVIGRREGCHLVLKDGWISREHSVVIEVAPGEFIIQDLESENGIFVNGLRVTEAPLKHSDIVRIGRTEMRFFAPGQKDRDGTEKPAARRESTVREHEVRPEAGPPRTSRFEQPLPLTPAPSRPAIDAALPLGEQPTDPAALDVTVHESGARAGRVDLRERVRRLEKLLQDKEEDNARLAAENAVFKRAMASAGLLNRQTGQMDVARLMTPAPREAVSPGLLRFVSNPLASVTYPTAEGEILAPRGAEGETDLAQGLFKLGIVGSGTDGARLADAFWRLGYRRVSALGARRDVLDGLDLPSSRQVVLDVVQAAKTLAEGRRAIGAAQLQVQTVLQDALGADRSTYLLACGLGGVTGVAAVPPVLEMLSDLDRRASRETKSQLPVGLLVVVPTAAELQDPERRALAREGQEIVRTVHAAGKVRPLIIVERRQLAGLAGAAPDAAAIEASTVAGVVDMMNRLPAIGPLSGPLDAETMRQLWGDGGIVTFGLAATKRAADPAALRECVRHAVGPGLLARGTPASRAQRAAVIAVIGSEVLAGNGAQALSRLESAVAEVQGILPQARPSTGIFEDDGDSVRIAVWLGGLPFPESVIE